MKNTFIVAAFVSITWMFAIPACTDKDDLAPNPLPPQPTLPYTKIMVGSGLDTLPLLSAGNTLVSGGNNLPPDTYYQFASNWQSRWICTQKPAGTPDPTIYDHTSMSARAVGLSTGDYRFEVTYTNAAGSKKSLMEVTVVPDKLAGTTVILDNLTWYVVTSGGLGEAVPPNATCWIESPDLFFFRGKRKEPTVEFLDPKSNQWIKATIYRDLPDLSRGQLRFNNTDDVYFDYTEGTMRISLYHNITADWLSGPVKSPPVRLTY